MRQTKEVSAARNLVRLRRRGCRPLPPDDEGMNDDRAVAAQVAVTAFGRAMKTDEGDLLSDLLCDLMHLSDRRARPGGAPVDGVSPSVHSGWDFATALSRARAAYTEEVAGSSTPVVASRSCQLCGAGEGKRHQDAGVVEGADRIQRMYEISHRGKVTMVCTLCRDGLADDGSQGLTHA